MKKIKLMAALLLMLPIVLSAQDWSSRWSTGGGASALAALADVDTSGIGNNLILKYNLATGNWGIAADSEGSGSGQWGDFGTYLKALDAADVAWHLTDTAENDSLSVAIDGSGNITFTTTTGNITWTTGNTGDAAFVIPSQSISSGEILDGTILDADINASAAISLSKTALTAGTNITLSTNTLNVDDAFLVNDANDATTGDITVSGGEVVLGSITQDGTLVIHDDDAGGDATVTIQALDATGTAYILTLPPDDGDADEVLKTNGSGVLDWVAQGGGSSEWTDFGTFLKPTENADVALHLTDTAADDSLMIDIDGTGNVSFTTTAGTYDFQGGNFGIGTAAPSTLLEVQGAAGAAGIATLSTAETSVVDGDILGSIYAQAPLESDGSDANLVSAAIDFEADATFDATTNNTEIVFRTGESETATEKMRLDSSGNLGIAKATPGARLDVSASGNGDGIRLRNSTDLRTLIVIRQADTDAGEIRILDTDAAVVVLSGNAGDDSYFNNGGNVGIGTASPTHDLTVANGATSGGFIAINEDTDNGTNNATFTVPALAADTDYTLPPDDGDAGEQLQTDGAGVLTWESAASKREAKNILRKWNSPQKALDAIMAVNLYDYTYKDGQGFSSTTNDRRTLYTGILAEEAPWAMHFEGGTLNPVNTFGYTVGAIQALQGEITALKKELKALKN